MVVENENWLALDIFVDGAAVEGIEFALNVAGALGTEIDLLGKRDPNAPVRVVGYFNERPDEEEMKAHVADALRIHNCAEDSIQKTEWRVVENEDWLVEWKKHWKATEIGRFVIAPPWEDIAETNKMVIRIEPNMAFGTGTHETTQLCLKAIGEIYRSGQSFLDVGTGTGILAIAAAKLAAADTGNLSVNSVPCVAKILACDTDEDSVRIAKENAVANGVSGQIEFFYGPIDEETTIFDLVCANLTLDMIVPLLPLLIAKSRSMLLLSGILVEQKDQIAYALRKSEISNFKFEIAGEWISVLVDFK